MPYVNCAALRHALAAGVPPVGATNAAAWRNHDRTYRELCDAPSALSIVSEVAVSVAVIVTWIVANRLLLRRNDDLRRRDYSEEVRLLNAEEAPASSPGPGRGYRSFRMGSARHGHVSGLGSKAQTPRNGAMPATGTLSLTGSIRSLPSEFSMHRYAGMGNTLDGPGSGAGSAAGDDDSHGLLFENPSFVESTRSSFGFPVHAEESDARETEFQDSVRPGRLFGDGASQLYLLVTAFCLYTSICNLALAMRRNASDVTLAEGVLIEVPPVVLYYLTIDSFLFKVVSVSDAVSPPTRWARRVRLLLILGPTIAVLVASQVVFVVLADSPSAPNVVPYPDCALATYLGALLLFWGMKALNDVRVAVAAHRLRRLQAATVIAGVFLLLRAVIMLPPVQYRLFEAAQNEVRSSGLWTAFLWVPLAFGLFFMRTLQAQHQSESEADN